ncbi:hypothetical protein CcaCcLH18_04760 [Colletotrichum camelliae]|nr:hypothetical protein CcaCcLH18_04760 [Colletotrichum camelliae]
MRSLFITTFATLAAAQSTPWPSFGNWTETAGGYDFTLSGPAKLGTKAMFELDRCHYVWNLLNERLYSYERPPSDATECMDQLFQRKSEIGDQGFLDIFEREIIEARQFWYEVNDKSELDKPETWKAVEARAVVSLPNVTAWAFSAWSSSPRADAANNRENAEHYFKHSDFTTGSSVSRILEGWGGTITNFTIPNYSVALCAERAMVRPLPEFLIKACGDKNLVDGKDTNFGVLNIAARDVDGASFGQPGKKGIDIYASIWYGGAISEEHLEAERQHVIIEIVNMSLKAQQDIETSAFTVPAPPTSDPQFLGEISIKYNKLSGKHVRFIGNSTGFGVAEAVLAAGASVTVSSSSASKLSAAVASLEAVIQSSQMSQKIQSFTADLSGLNAEENLDAMFEQAGPIDHVVLTAADSLSLMMLQDLTPDKILAACRMRLVAPLMAIKVAARYLPKSNEKQLAVELKPLRFNAVAPGHVDTGLWDHMTAEEKANIVKGIEEAVPTGQFGRVEDVVEAYLWLLKDRNATGMLLLLIAALWLSRIPIFRRHYIMWKM